MLRILRDLAARGQSEGSPQSVLTCLSFVIASAWLKSRSGRWCGVKDLPGSRRPAIVEITQMLTKGRSFAQEPILSNFIGPLWRASIARRYIFCSLRYGRSWHRSPAARIRRGVQETSTFRKFSNRRNVSCLSVAAAFTILISGVTGGLREY